MSKKQKTTETDAEEHLNQEVEQNVEASEEQTEETAETGENSSKSNDLQAQIEELEGDKAELNAIKSVFKNELRLKLSQYVCPL